MHEYQGVLALGLVVLELGDNEGVDSSGNDGDLMGRLPEANGFQGRVSSSSNDREHGYQTKRPIGVRHGAFEYLNQR